MQETQEVVFNVGKQLKEVKPIKHIYSLKERMALCPGLLDSIDAKVFHKYRFLDDDGIERFNMTKYLDDNEVNTYTYNTQNF
jgi:hypothetical protein